MRRTNAPSHRGDPCMRVQNGNEARKATPEGLPMDGELRDYRHNRVATLLPGATTSRRRAHNELIKRHFAPLAPDYPRLKRKNRFYNEYLTRWCASLVPPGR